MKKKTNLMLLLAPAFVLTAATLLTACSDKDDDDLAVQPHAYSYATWLYGEEGSQQVVLDSLASLVINVADVPSWITVRTEPVGGHPAVIMEYSGITGTSPEDAVLKVTAENGDVATITVRHSKNSLGDAYSGGNASFIKEWWKCQTVQINGIAAPQKTPWTIEGGINIPPEVRDSYRPDQGWEMAFSCLNDATTDGTRYFALYNKYTGQLRVYIYLLNPGGEGNELSFMVKMGEYGSNDMYPLYHSYEFGIPNNHVLGTSLSRSPVIYEGQNQAFMTLVTPYRQSSSLANGWHCFDLDMSAYVPQGKNWRDPNRKEAKLSIFPDTETTQQVTLWGSILGDISGTFSNERIIQHGGGNCMSGLCGMLNWISNTAASSLSSTNQYAHLMSLEGEYGGGQGSGAFLNPLKYWGGFGCSIVSGALGLLGDSLAAPVSYDTIPGKIDLKADLQLDASGYIKTFNSTNIRGLGVSMEAITSANGNDGHVGKGIWGLADDPVVYIDKDDILSSYDHFNIQAKPNGYSSNNFGAYEARLVYAFDPTSVKVNINPDLYPEINDVNVTTTVGVFPSRNYGYTDPYRSFLMLPARPKFSLAEGKTSGIVRLSGSSQPRVWKVAPADLIDTAPEAYENKSNCEVVTQTGGSIRYYGRPVKEFFKTIMVNPDVYIPYSGGTIGYPEAPDFVVAVTLSFYTRDARSRPKDAEPCTFSKVFIPKIQMVSREEMKAVSARIQEYANNCKEYRPVGVMANDYRYGKVNVKNHGGDKLMEKTLRMLKKIGL